MPLEDLRQDRLKKLTRLEKERINPYPAEATRTHSVREARASFDALSSAGTEVEIAGRVMGLRDQGGVVFLDLREEDATLQVVLKKDSLDTFALFAEVLDIGDFISVGGILFKTSKGEESIEARKLTMLAKSIRPLPGEWHGLRDVETRLRKRYLELILNSETRELFEKKAVFWKTCRDFLTREGFIEVETPTLQKIAGGADAEPFVTYHQTLGTDFYLRIALELPLKKLLIGGYDKVFEIGRIFRNEGISREHLQDYTQLEFYWAYHDYRDLMKFVEKLYQEVIQAVTGGLTTTWQGKPIDWGGEWPVLEYVELFEKENGFNPLALSRDALFKKAVSLGFEPEENLGKGRLIDHIYKRTVRPKFVEPAFLVNPPVELVPLAKRMPEDPRLALRMQPVACGTELGNGFSELNDPLDQRARFEEQMKLREKGDREAQLLDEEYLEAMEYGMPPAAGFGVSERFFAVLMDKPVRETVLFPLMRPKEEQ